MQLWEGDRSNIANIGKPQEDADAHFGRNASRRDL